jgi:hypothetical protein
MGACDPPDPSKLVAQAATLFDIHDDVSRVIRDLKIPTEDLRDAYGIKGEADATFDFEPMLRLFLYKEVAGFSQKELAERVEQWPYLRTRLNLDRAPTQQTISHTKRNRFSLELRQFISEAAGDIVEEARERGIRSKSLRSADENPDPDEITQSKEPIHHYVDQNAPELINSLLDIVTPSFDTGRADNAKHDDRTVWEHQTVMSLMDTAGTRASYRTYNKFRNDALHHDTHTRAVKKLGTPVDYQYTFSDFPDSGENRTVQPNWRSIAESVQTQFGDATERMLESARQSEMFTEPLVAAIDITSVPYHVTPWKGEDDIEPDDERVKTRHGMKVPKNDYPEMVNGGTDDWTYEYQYATLTIVGRNVPLVVAVEPVRHDSVWEGEEGESVSYAEIVDRLMEQATELVDIHLVMADRAFDTHGVAHVLNQHHDVNYLIPKTRKSDRLREDADRVREDEAVNALVEQDVSLYLDDSIRYADVDGDETIGEDGYSHDVTFMHVPADRDDWVVMSDDKTGYATFVTNRSGEISPMDAIGFTNRYSDRWDIEIEYKMILPLVPSIASTDYRMRFFSFVFSCLLYNMWRLTDHSLKVLVTEAYDDYGRGKHEEREDPLLPLADYLASSFVLLLHRSGLDPPV